MNAKFNESSVLQHISNSMTTSIIIAAILIIIAFSVVKTQTTVN